MKRIAITLTALTVLIALGIVGLVLGYIWGGGDERLINTAFLFAFVAIATGGAAGFSWVAVDE